MNFETSNKRKSSCLTEKEAKKKKKILQALPQILNNLCISYTCAVLVYTLLDCQKSMMRRGWLYEILLICLAATLLQYVFFSGKAVKRLSYLWRMAIFAVLMLGVVSGAAVLFQWFPLDQMGSWLWFVGIFLVGFAAITLVFELVFRFKRREYDEALGRYKRQNPGQ